MSPSKFNLEWDDDDSDGTEFVDLDESEIVYDDEVDV